jgi:hypothetical protein
MSRLLALVFAATLFPTLAAAQPEDPNRWGVAVGFVPEFSIKDGSGVLGKLAEVMFSEGDKGLDVKGGDFRIGVVRGRRLGGEWGVSYVRRSFKDESRQGGVETQCFPAGFPASSTICATNGLEYFYSNDVVLDAIEANKLIVFTTIKNVVQIGLDLGGGIGWMKGTAIERTTDSNFQGNINIPPNSTVNLPTTVTEVEVPASTLVAVDPVPIGRVELSVGFLLGNNVKVRASGGMNIPGTHIFSVTGSVFLR